MQYYKYAYNARRENEKEDRTATMKKPSLTVRTPGGPSHLEDRHLYFRIDLKINSEVQVTNFQMGVQGAHNTQLTSQ